MKLNKIRCSNRCFCNNRDDSYKYQCFTHNFQITSYSWKFLQIKGGRVKTSSIHKLKKKKQLYVVCCLNWIKLETHENKKKNVFFSLAVLIFHFLDFRWKHFNLIQARWLLISVVSVSQKLDFHYDIRSTYGKWKFGLKTAVDACFFGVNCFLQNFHTLKRFWNENFYCKNDMNEQTDHKNELIKKIEFVSKDWWLIFL